MKISLNWLKDYVETDISVERICEILTDTGLEVEGLRKVESIPGGLKGVVIGEVLSCEKHPDADRLNVTTVDLGKEQVQIVCGATNVVPGILVPVATVGCTLYPNPDEPFKIKKSKIRGVESNGMICAEDELGLGTEHDGIMVLDSSAIKGSEASSYFKVEDDYEIEIGLTPNRSDAMGHIGVARDLVAYLNFHDSAKLELTLPGVDDFSVTSNDYLIDVQIENEEVCPRYTGTTITGVKIQDSPEWLQNRLKTIGLVPINNVVDATNYVMHEFGSPLHAFDGDKLNGKIVVKNATDDSKFTTLDDVERKLNGSNLMITNGAENLCIAGVLGGIDSGISASTTNVFLESAYFNPVSIRKTAKMHGLNTDASFRFERGTDPRMTDYVLKRTAVLIQQLAGGQISMEVFDSNPSYGTSTVVEFDYDRCNKLIGTTISQEKVDQILESLDIKVVSKSGNIASLEIPTYRVDVTREADVVEEVLRIYGFNNVPNPEKLNSSIAKFTKPDLEKIQNVCSELLVGFGCNEILNNSLTKSEYVEKHGGEVMSLDTSVQMLNPLSQDLDVMRQSLIFNALETVSHNQNRQNSNVKLFEFGKTYNRYESGFSENKRLLIAVSGLKESESWNASKDVSSYFTMKGIVEGVLERLGLKALAKYKGVKKSILEDGTQVYVLKNKVGEIGWASNAAKKEFGIKNDVFIADLDWDAIIDSLKFTKIKFSELPKTFAVRRDFSLLLDKEISFSQIEEIGYSSDKKILKDIGLFDVYEGKGLKEGTKSYAVSFHFQDAENTLKDKQVDYVMEKIRTRLENDLKAELR